MRTTSAFYTSQTAKQPSKLFTNGLLRSETQSLQITWHGPEKKYQLQKRVQGEHRLYMGHRKEQKEVIWDNPTNRIVYQWVVGPITRSTTWTNTVRNRFRQKAGENEAFRALEIGEAKWCKEHIPWKGI
jgi:hypothetical protein